MKKKNPQKVFNGKGCVVCLCVCPKDWLIEDIREKYFINSLFGLRITFPPFPFLNDTL